MTDIINDTVPDRGATDRLEVDMSPAVQIPAGILERKLFTGVMFKAETANTGVIYIGFGNSITTATGWPLPAGETITIPADALDRLWFISDTDNQFLRWIAL